MMNDRNWDEFWRDLGWVKRRTAQHDLTERLQQRAEQYARSVARPMPEEAHHTMLTFALGDETYGVDVHLVQSVRMMDTVVMVPGVPDFYAGVVNIRGNIITVMDLRLFFGLSVTGDPPQELIVMRAGGMQLGLLAHHVREMRRIPHDNVSVLDDIQYALGVTNDRLVLLDIERLFTDSRLIVGEADV